MNKLTKSSRNLLFAVAIASILTFATSYVPMLNEVAAACAGVGSGC